ncbi:flavin-containing amine oxidoreductase-domain containing protein [Aspergillus californicus]
MMQATSTLVARPPSGGFSSQTDIFHQYIPSAAVVNSDEHPAKRLRTLLPTAAHLQQKAPGSLLPQVDSSIAVPQDPDSIPNGVNSGNENQSMTYTTYNLVTETNGNTPNDSTTSTSFSSASSHGKSTTPSTVGNIASSSTSIDSRRPEDVPDFSKYRPRSSIPSTSKLPTPVYAQQCVEAAYDSRLNPYALHATEQEALQDYMCHLHVTLYLNIRNGILRLWTRNPMVSVTKEEALGCTKEHRWMNLASFAYEWLLRNGYINFGCCEIPTPLLPPKKGRRKEGPVVVIIGAGMAGLGCARQLEGLFKHYRDNTSNPRVIVLEGRRRIGGRIYSHPLRGLRSSRLPPGLVPKAEMGAQIVVGFDRGNPLDQIIRGQLALSYHQLRDQSTIYDIDGSPVDETRDATAESLYNDVLDRSGAYRHKSIIIPTAEGDRELIDSGREIGISDGVTVRQYEEARAAGTIGLLLPAKRIRRGVGHKTADIKPAGVPVADSSEIEENPAINACQAMGWKPNNGFSPNDTINLDPVARASNSQTLGNVMDEGVSQYKRMLPLTPKDLRLINWHFANLEYANATNINNLSLSGWDQDMGNEFEGEHSQVIGGYQRVPYGLWSHPTKLDVRTNKIVTRITSNSSASNRHKMMVECEDGDSIPADKVVYTGSLGTLKHRSVHFSPPLPDWKQTAIDRLGFGVMNKVILTFDQPFWETDRDMFGLLREPENSESMVQEDYAANRGRFYLFWNCMKTTGLPVLIALMAGDAAHQAERTPDAILIADVMSQLRNVFKQVAVPDPLETIITRWASDKFTRGTYSYVAAEALPGDYDLMAKPIGNLHFAGEATCGTHPATVHGAYLSGLRAASDIIASIHGPISIPNPLVLDKKIMLPNGMPLTPQDNNSPDIPSQQPPTPSAATTTTFALRAAYDQAMLAAVTAETGPPLQRPRRTGLNPFILYQKDHWPRARAQADAAHRLQTRNPESTASLDSVRATIGGMWRNAPEEERGPYERQAKINRQTNAEISAKWKAESAEWEARTEIAKKRWRRENPFEGWVEEPPRKEMNQDPTPDFQLMASLEAAQAMAPEIAPAPSLPGMPGNMSTSTSNNVGHTDPTANTQPNTIGHFHPRPNPQDQDYDNQL